jgi:diguanylate cyclase (GGDEF)-like protein
MNWCDSDVTADEQSHAMELTPSLPGSTDAVLWRSNVGVLARGSIGLLAGAAAGWLLIAGVVLFSASTIPGVRDTPGFDTTLDGWLQGSLYVLAAAVAFLGIHTAGSLRVPWRWIAWALAARAVGFVLYLAHVRTLDPQPYPSLADAAWIVSALLLIVGLVTLGRVLFSQLSVSLTLDGVVGACAAGAITIAFLYDTLIDIAGRGATSEVATNLAYPALDLIVLLVLLGVLVASRWSPPLPVWGLVAGVIGFAVLDITFVYQAANNTFRPATPLSALSIAATAVIAMSGSLPFDPAAARARRDTLPTLLLPGLFTAVCAGLLVIAAFRDIEPGAIALAALGLIVALVRTSSSFHTLRKVAGTGWGSRIDELTGLPNRRSFHQTLAGAFGRSDGNRYALLLVDVDDFAAVNDSYGQAVGDELLIRISQRLRQVVPVEPHLARVGGDEFAILAVVPSVIDAVEVARRTRAHLLRSFPVGGSHVTISASVGVAVYPDDSHDVAQLVQHAELALRDAKRTSSGHRAFRPDLHAVRQRRVETVARMRQAIDEGELVLHYQPQVDLDTRATIGVEALLRWNHPELGLLTPDAFLPQTEGEEVMRELTRHVISLALPQAALWRSQGHRHVTSVNVTVADLLHPAFPDLIGSELERFDVPGSALELELTEDLFLAEPARAREMLGSLLELGVGVVIDDYGTGYSSLGYVRELEELRGLKIDQSFIRHLERGGRTHAIVESTIILAHSLNLQVVAEGVETEVERAALADMGCGLAQGYLFGRPVPAAQLWVDGLGRPGPAATDPR